MNSTNTAVVTAAPRASTRTIDGIEFDPTERQWTIPTAHGSVCFNFDNLPGATEPLRQHVREAFAALLLANAPERLGRMLVRLRALLKFLIALDPAREISELTAADLQNYGASLPNHQQYFLRHVRSLLMEWAKTGVAGLSRDWMLLLPSLETKSHAIGAAVLTMDPERGPLTDLEYESVLAGLRQAFASGDMPIYDYALVVLAIALGCRAMQLAMMKVKDLLIFP